MRRPPIWPLILAASSTTGRSSLVGRVLNRAGKWVLRHRGLVASLAAAVGLIGMALAYAGWHYTALLHDHNAALEAEAARADQHAEESDRLRQLADRHAYAASLRLADLAVQGRQFEVAQDLLDSIRTLSTGEDIREFAWRYLSHAARHEIVRLPVRDSETREMALTRDGRTLLSKHHDRTIILWDLATESPRSILESFDAVDLAISPRGRYVLGTRNASDGKRREELVLHDTATGNRFGRSLDVSARRPGEYLASGFISNERGLACVWEGGDGRHSVSVRTWDLNLDPAMHEPLVSLDGLRFATFAPGGDRFVTIDEKGVLVRDTSTGAIRAKLSDRADATGWTVLSEDGLWLAVHFPEDLIVVLDTSNGTERERHQIVGGIQQLRFCRDASVLAAVDRSGTVHLLDRTAAGPRMIKMPVSEGTPNFVVVAFSVDGKRLATVRYFKPGGYEVPSVWDVATGRCLIATPGSDKKTHQIIFTPDGRSLIIGGPRSPRIWHFDPIPDPPSPVGHKDEAWAAAYSPDGKILGTGSDDTEERQTIKLWDPATGRLIRGWNGGAGTVASLALSPDGRFLASGHLADGNNIRIWDVSTGGIRHTLGGHGSVVRSVAFAPDGRTLASAGGRKSQGNGDGTIRLWDVATASCVRQLEGHSDMVRLARVLARRPNPCHGEQRLDGPALESPDGATVAAERSSAQRVAVAFAPDGATLAVAANSGVVTIHDATSLVVLKTIRHENREVLLNLAFAHDGRSLAVTGTSGTIRLWDPLTGQELLRWQGHKTQVNGLAFAPDGSSLTSCSHDGEVKLWRAGSIRDRPNP